ncbi:MAG: SIS domain-containing protein [Actinobacteria bacterium]|nr:SIS domain-containing protein [Actinomycetota bacterium]
MTDTGLPATALALARVFSAGGRLIVSAEGRPDHARHVAVEFVHPAITGARSLPSIAVAPEDIHHVVRPHDALLVLESAEWPFERPVPENAQLLIVGRQQTEPELVRWYHVLWELVQIGLEHPGLTGGAASLGGDSTNFLYPFLDATEDDEPALLASMAESAVSKQAESNELATQTLAANAAAIEAVVAQIRSCLSSGRSIFVIGNGGSACDAGRLARLLQGSGAQTRSLADDPAILTALANDLGVDKIFSRQVEASARPGDVLVIFSTSGASRNLLSVLDLSLASELIIVACAGYGGGPLVAHHQVDHKLVVDSPSVHRVQEAQGFLIDEICTQLAPSAVHA